MNIFITGATGFIGGSVASHLLQAGHAVRGLVRNQDDADALTSFGVTPVLRDLDDRDVLIHEAQRAEAVVNAASSDHRSSVEALLEGLRDTGKPFLHTSGSSVICSPVGRVSVVDSVMSGLSEPKRTFRPAW